MSSLQASITPLSKILRLNPHALYERQLGLMGKLLPARTGRGPGSGTPFSAETVAMLVISMMVTDSIKECVEKTSALFDAPRTETTSKNKRALGGARTFGEAIVNALTSDEHAREVALVRVFRATSAGQILLAGRGGMLEFAPKKTRPAEEYQGMAGFYQIVGGMDENGVLAKVRALLRDDEKATKEDLPAKHQRQSKLLSRRDKS